MWMFLNLNFGQRSADLLKFVNLADEEISIALSNLGVRNVDHVTIYKEVNLWKIEVSIK